MIIFGSRGIRMKGGSGSFYCPRCAGTRQYTHRKVRRFFTLYFIPLIPLDLIGEYVECNYCQTTFKPEVVEYDPRVEQRRADGQIKTTLRRALLSVLVADGVPGDAKRDVAVKVINGIAAEPPMTRTDIDAAIDPAMKRVTNASRDVEAIAEGLDYTLREELVRASVTIALAGGSMSAAEEKQIRALAMAAGITDAHLAGIMSTSPRGLSAPSTAFPS